MIPSISIGNFKAFAETQRIPICPLALTCNDKWKNRFNFLLQPVVSETDLSIEVSIWDDFHDRCLTSNLIGISLPNGFDVRSRPDDITTWTRLSRIDRDDLQREFDPASGRHKKHGGFTICPS